MIYRVMMLIGSWSLVVGHIHDLGLNGMSEAYRYY